MLLALGCWGANVVNHHPGAEYIGGTGSGLTARTLAGFTQRRSVT